MSDIQKELDEITNKFNLNEDERQLVLMLSVYKVDLPGIKSKMNEFEYHKVMRGFKKDKSKRQLLDHLLEVRKQYL